MMKLAIANKHTSLLEPPNSALVEKLFLLSSINEDSGLCMNDRTNFLFTVRNQLASFLATDPLNILSINCTAGTC